MKAVDTIEHHLQNPEGSVEQYVRTKRLKLAEEMRGCLKIYLDTKYWILFRDVHLGRSASDEVKALLGTIETLVVQKKALCPISVDIFAEIFRQSDPKTFQATVKLVDDLSRGVTILEFGERLRLEAFHFIRSKTLGDKAVCALDELIWTKVAYVLGFVTPTSPNLADDVDRAVQKAFVDQLWVVTLTDIADILGTSATGRPGWFSNDVADALNAGKVSHVHEYSSFKELFLNELAGILDLQKPMLTDLMNHINQANTRKTVAPDEVAKTDAGRLIVNLIYNAFRLDKIKSELPSFRIGAGLHAAIRWDSKRKYKVNDFHDIHHAVTAIPYYDWFLTEHGLRHLVTDRNLNLGSLFKCKTISDPAEALPAMSQLLG